MKENNKKLGQLLRKDVGRRLSEEVTFQLRSEGCGGGTKCTGSKKSINAKALR